MEVSVLNRIVGCRRECDNAYVRREMHEEMGDRVDRIDTRVCAVEAKFRHHS
jgi:hypothetical protein